MVVKYTCVLDGAIGAGKSSSFELVGKWLIEKYGSDNVVLIPEYIDANEDAEIYRRSLMLYLNGTFNDLTFQNIIQHYYIKELDPSRLDGKIVIMERAMSSSISIFCNLAYHRGRLDDTNFAVLHGNCLECDRHTNTPNYFLGNFQFSRVYSTVSLDEVVSNIKSIIENDITNGIRNRVIGLDCDFLICEERIKRRGRGDEVKAYDSTYTSLNTSMYSKLYDFLESPRHSIRFTELSSIVSQSKLDAFLENQARIYIDKNNDRDPNDRNFIREVMDIIRPGIDNSEYSLQFHNIEECFAKK